MTCRVTVSIGVSGVNADSVRTTEAALITSADKALYVAKNEGRHTVRFREVEPESEDVNQGDGKKTGTDG